MESAARVDNATTQSFRSTMSHRTAAVDSDGIGRQQFQTDGEENPMPGEAFSTNSSSPRLARHSPSATLSVSTVPLHRAPSSSVHHQSVSSMAAALAVGSTPHGIDYILSKSSLSPTLSTSSSSSTSCTSAEAMSSAEVESTPSAGTLGSGVRASSAVDGTESVVGGPSLRSPGAPVAPQSVLAQNLECGGLIGQHRQMQSSDSLRAVVGPYGWAAVAAAAAAGMLPWKPHHPAGNLARVRTFIEYIIYGRRSIMSCNQRLFT